MTATDTQTETASPEAQDAQEAIGVLQGEDDGIETMYLTFPIANETYGVPITMVTEIVGIQRVMSVPDVPDYIKGVINLRGKVIPLMDVRLRFGMEERAYDERTVVIVLEVANAPVGLIVDGVSEVIDIPDEKVGRSGVQGGNESSSVVSGLGHIEDRVAILLDVSVLVSEVEIDAPQAPNA